MLKVNFLLLFLFWNQCLFSQLASKVIECEDGSTGYTITYKKKPIDNFVYTEAFEDNGFMFVTRDDRDSLKYGVYAPDGRLIIEPKYDPLELMFVHEKPTFFIISELSASGETNFGLFDLNGKILLEPIYHEISLVEDYFDKKPMVYIQLMKKNEAGAIHKGIANAEGKVIIEPRYLEIEWTIFEGFENRYYYKALAEQKKYLFDSNGRLVIGDGFDEIGEFCGGRKLISVRKKWWNEEGEDRLDYGFFDLEAEKEVFPCIFDNWESMGNDRVLIEKGENVGLISPNGYLLEPMFESIAMVSDSGLFLCQNKGEEYFQVFIARSKKMLDVKCTDAYENWPLLIMQLPSANEGDVSDLILYNLETNQLLNERCQSYEMSEFSQTTILKNGKWYLMSKDGILGSELPGTWNRCAFLSEKVLMVEFNQLFGLIKSDGKVILSPKYEEMTSSFKEGICVKLNGKYGMIDYSGNEIISCQYTGPFVFDKGRAEVSDESGTFFINRKNERVE